MSLIITRPALANSSFVVNVTTDAADTASDGVCDSDAAAGNQCSLRAAIQNANANADASTITFDAVVFGTAQTITAASEMLVDTGPLTLDGPGADKLTLSGGTTTRPLRISTGITAEIRGMTIANGSSLYGGGLNNDGQLVVRSSTFVNNLGGNGGGAIHNGINGVLTVIGSTFSGNNGFQGGAIDNLGTLLVYNSTFSTNTATDSTGGAIDSDGSLTIVNSTFVDNQFAGFGSVGGIRASGTTTLRNNIIANSTGANCSLSGTLTRNNNLATDNTCGTGFTQMTSAQLALGTLVNNGGTTQTIALLPNSVAINAGDNSAATNAGLTNDQRGAARIADSIVDIGAFELECGTTPFEIAAGDSQGLINAITCANGDGVDSVINLTNSIYTLAAVNNNSSGPIGLPVITNGTLTINGNGATITRDSNAPAFRLMHITNNGTNLTLNNLTLSNGKADVGGAFRIISGSTITLNNTTLSGNSSTNGGGAFYVTSPASIVNVNNSTISGNSVSAGSGGGFQVTSNGGTVNVNNSTISGNSASLNGGGFSIGGLTGEVKVNNSTISGNSASSSGGGGFAINSSGVMVTINNTIVANSISGSDCRNNLGFLLGSHNLVETPCSGLSLSNTLRNIDPGLDPAGLQDNGGPTKTIALMPNSPAIDAGNNANAPAFSDDQRGAGFPRLIAGTVDLGAVEASCASTPFNIPAGESYNLTHAINCANTDGVNSVINLTNSTYTLNTAHNSTGGDGDNGLPAIANNGTLTINGNGATITRDTSGPSFRLMFIESGAHLTLDTLTLSNGTATSGGGFYNLGTVTLSNSTVSTNTASLYGGGFYNDLGMVTVVSSTFSDNDALQGGGFYNNNNSTVNAHNSTFFGNSGTNFGGGFVNNGTSTVNNSTVAGNFTSSSNGGGGFSNGGTLTLTNSIIADNISGGDCVNQIATSPTLTGSHNLIETPCTGSLANNLPNTLYNVDPGFDLAGLQDNGGTTQTVALLPNSRAIDAGSNAAAGALTTDQRGQPRFYNDTGVADTGSGSAPIVDIGAFEVQTNSTIPTVSISDANVVEGNSGNPELIFTVSLSSVNGQPVTMNFASSDDSASAPSDYTAVSNALTFTPGETSHQISVVVNSDTVFETDETFVITLSAPPNATLADAQGVGTITNDDAQPSASINLITLSEGNTGSTPFTFTVSLSNPSYQTITLDAYTENGGAIAGSDYIALPLTPLTFAPGETSKQITVNVQGDTTHEISEVFVVYLDNATNVTVTPFPGIGLITNDDGKPNITINDLARTEGNSGTTNIPFTVSLSNPSYQTITVNFATADGTATLANNDYTAHSGVLSFAPGQTSRQLTVTANGDLTFEPHETLHLNLSSPTNAVIADNLGVGTIANDDSKPTITINDVSRPEGNSGTTNFPFVVTLSNPSYQTITVNFATADGTATLANSDYIARSGVLSFAPGVTSRQITVQGNGDTVVEPNEIFNVYLSNNANANIGDNRGIGTITNDDGSGFVAPLTLSAFAANLTEAESTSYTVALAASPAELLASDTVTVALSFDPAYLNVTPASLTLDTNTWNIPQTVTVLAVDDTQALQPSISLPILHTLTAGDVSLNGAPFGVTITDNDVYIVPVAPELPQIETVAPVSPDAPVQPVQPTEAVPLLPAGAETGNPVMFMWRAATGATSYNLQITTDAGEIVYEAVFSAAVDCAGEICQVLPNVALTGGAHYLWSIQADSQPRSFAMAFTYNPVSFLPIVTP